MLLSPCSKRSQGVYRPRRPGKTVLFQAVKKHYKTWEKNAQHPIPRHVQRTFEKYLECGDPDKGFAWAHCEGCNADFFIAFSCKGRGICPSCNTRTMVATAAHLIENVIPLVPIRQWVISFPFRIRHYLLEPKTIQDVLKIVVDEIRKTVLTCCPGHHNTLNPRIGAVSFMQNFGATLNVHPHFHLIVADGLFSMEADELQFREASFTQDDIRDTQDHIQERVLRLFRKRGKFTQVEIEKMMASENSGFSLDASVKIPSWDREGLERLIRYCARPSFASENLRWHRKRLIYRLSKPNHRGQTSIELDPLEFLTKIAAFIPSPRRHRRHYHGAFAPNSPLRRAVVEHAKLRLDQIVPPHLEKEVKKAKQVSLDWATLIARIYEIDPMACSRCGKKITIMGFVTDAEQIHRILRGIGWPKQSQEFDPPYDLPNWDICQLLSDTSDGFPSMEEPVYRGTEPDPPSQESYSDPPHWEDYSDPPHWND